MNPKTRIFFGPPLIHLTENEKNTMEISGKINRTAERYMEILRHHGSIDLTEPERECLRKVCDIGFMAPYEIREMAIDVRDGDFDIEGLDKQTLINKLEAASFVQLVATVEELGF